MSVFLYIYFLDFLTAAEITVLCEDEYMTVLIAKSLLPGVDRAHLRLLDASCTATETSTHFSLTTPLTGCLTVVSHTPTSVIYSNKVLEIPSGINDVERRTKGMEISFSCQYSLLLSECKKMYPSGGMRKRQAPDHVTDKYSLVQGLIHLAPDKRDGNKMELSDNSGELKTDNIKTKSSINIPSLVRQEFYTYSRGLQYTFLSTLSSAKSNACNHKQKRENGRK